MWNVSSAETGVLAIATIRKACIELLDFAWLFCRLTNEGIEFPFLTLLVSGGHNLLLLAHSIGRYTQLGTTLDDALGEVRTYEFALEEYWTHVLKTVRILIRQV
jgi:hypothetical protein